MQGASLKKGVTPVRLSKDALIPLLDIPAHLVRNKMHDVVLRQLQSSSEGLLTKVEFFITRFTMGKTGQVS